jgi:hypothetical protein
MTLAVISKYQYDSARLVQGIVFGAALGTWTSNVAENVFKSVGQSAVDTIISMLLMGFLFFLATICALICHTYTIHNKGLNALFVIVSLALIASAWLYYPNILKFETLYLAVAIFVSWAATSYFIESVMKTVPPAIGTLKPHQPRTNTK